MKIELEFAQNLAREAGAIMREHFGIGTVHTMKDNDTPVTDADTLINQLIIERVRTHFPTDSILGEEESDLKESTRVWVVDPIDGTVAFLRGIPISVCSIALVEDGIPILGVVYDPFQDRLYHATQGSGAYMNDIRIHVSEHREIRGAYIACDGFRVLKNLDFLNTLKNEGGRLVSYNSIVYSHMLVASGQFDGAIFVQNNPWDSAAAKIIVEEAGGVTSDIRGNSQLYDQKTNGFISSNSPELQAQLIDILAPSLAS